MAKKKKDKKGFRSGRLAKAYFSRGGMGLAKDIYLKKTNPKKYKRKDRVRRYSEDGKITKKEAKKLRKRGISEQEVQRQYDKDYKASVQSWEGKGPGPSGYKNPASRPQYAPLTFTGGASKQFGKGMTISSPKPRGRERDRRRSSETSSTDKQISDFQEQREDQFAMYEQMMIQQAMEAEEQRRQMEAAMRAQAANAYGASMQPTFQLQGAGTTPKLSGIQQFKKRAGSQFGTASPYTGLAKIQSGMVNA